MPYGANTDYCWLKPRDPVMRIAVKCLYTWPAEIDLIGDVRDENKRVYQMISRTWFWICWL